MENNSHDNVINTPFIDDDNVKNDIFINTSDDDDNNNSDNDSKGNSNNNSSNSSSSSSSSNSSTTSEDIDNIDLDDYKSVLLLCKEEKIYNNQKNERVENKQFYPNKKKRKLNNIESPQPQPSLLSRLPTLSSSSSSSSSSSPSSPPPPSSPTLSVPPPSDDQPPLLITNCKEVVDIIYRHERQVMSDSELYLGYASTKMPKEFVECLLMFRDEMTLILQEYARLRRSQQLLGNFNTNSINYADEMVKKMIDIILRIDKNSMSVDKYRDVVREALYIYHLVVSKMTGPKHLKRLRTPELHFDFCMLIALLSHNVENVKNISTKYRVSSIIQFVSALDCQWYLSVVPSILSVFNRSNSICHALSFSYMRHAQVNITLCLVFALTETNTTNLVLGVILYLFPESLESIKTNELIKDESLIIPLCRKIKEHLRSQWIDRMDITNAAYLLLGSCTDGLDTIKVFKKHNYDKKIVAVSIMIQQKLKQLNQSICFH
uniref:Wsv282-like protein n=1 Tax=Melicertus latisulcatus majanivirus TaxID=2984277 RepID=A0A9C7C5Y0_9VIRU|nr:MAG: wsv282-like protein [Melicertus latisulcatus majanivirus]